MKISVIFVTFSLLHLLNSSIIFQPETDKFLSQSICQMVNGIISSKSHTQDVLIGHINAVIWPTILDDIRQCLSNDVAVVLSDLRELDINLNMKKASVVIFTLENLNVVSLQCLENIKKVIKILCSIKGVKRRFKGFITDFLDKFVSHWVVGGK